MATRQQFCDLTKKYYEYHSMYVGGANGQRLFDLGFEGVQKCEEGYEGRDHFNDLYRDYMFIAKLYKARLDLSETRAGDCSGMYVGIMRELGIISKKADYRACEFQALCEEIPLKDLSDGDLVFDTKKPKAATHMAAFVDGYIYESRGRDYGFVKRKVSEGNWASGGRLPKGWFDDAIPVLTRNLRYIKDNLMKGKDVEECQEQLVKKGYNPGVVDGIFGLKTEDAVIAFQTANDLDVDGVVGQKTWAKLFE